MFAILITKTSGLSDFNAFEYCPRGYIEGVYYSFIRPSTVGIIRVRVLFKGGSYLRKYGISKCEKIILFTIIMSDALCKLRALLIRLNLIQNTATLDNFE